MNEHVIKFIEAPIPVRAAAFAAIGAMVIGAYWFLFYQDLHLAMTELEAKTVEVRNNVSQKEKIAANLPKFEAEVDRLDVELKKALSELPDEKEIPQLLEKIADKAKDAGLDVRLFRPKSEQRKDFYAEVPVEIEVGGGFHQVATFFDEVAHLERIVNIDSFSMLDPKMSETGPNLKSSLVATSFRFLNEAERPKESEGSGKRRRKRASSGDEE